MQKNTILVMVKNEHSTFLYDMKVLKKSRDDLHVAQRFTNMVVTRVEHVCLASTTEQLYMCILIKEIL